MRSPIIINPRLLLTIQRASCIALNSLLYLDFFGLGRPTAFSCFPLRLELSKIRRPAFRDLPSPPFRPSLTAAGSFLLANFRAYSVRQQALCVRGLLLANAYGDSRLYPLVLLPLYLFASAAFRNNGRYEIAGFPGPQNNSPPVSTSTFRATRCLVSLRRAILFDLNAANLSAAVFLFRVSYSSALCGKGQNSPPRNRRTENEN